MRSKGGRTVNITPVDEDPRARVVHDLNERGGTRMEALFDQNMFRMHIRRERSSAYWFAASVWGITGLLVGGCMGAFLMYQASVASMPMAQEALARGMAVEQARARSEEHPTLDLNHPSQPAQPAHNQP